MNMKKKILLSAMMSVVTFMVTTVKTDVTDGYTDEPARVRRRWTSQASLRAERESSGGYKEGNTFKRDL